jgi:hypothetical protein
MDKSQFPKVQCRAMFMSEGEVASRNLGSRLAIPDTKMDRWIREWSNKMGPKKVDLETRHKENMAIIDRRKKKVEIFPGKNKKSKQMIGYVMEGGPEQSQVYIIDGPESLINKVQIFMNKDLKEIPKPKREV